LSPCGTGITATEREKKKGGADRCESRRFGIQEDGKRNKEKKKTDLGQPVMSSPQAKPQAMLSTRIILSCCIHDKNHLVRTSL
jgi:hypothetical protein